MQIFDHNNRSLDSFLPRIISFGEHGKSWICPNCFQNSNSFFYTHVDNTERARETNLVARKISKFYSGGEKMRNASGQVKISGSEKIEANMNTGNKIFGKHI